MASNFFGQIFRVTTFGESHGPAIGVVIDGCPAGLPLSNEEIEYQLSMRQCAKNPFTSPRSEPDRVEILSGMFEGITTGAPIAIVIQNRDADSSQYESIKDLYRPGHANFAYLEKYGVFDYRGGGRASARETAARVAAGAVAKKMLAHFGIDCAAYISLIGPVAIKEINLSDMKVLREKIRSSPVFCPDETASCSMIEELKKIKEAKDSLGGVVSCIAHLPAGFGDPIYCKLQAMLASAMLSIPASKGFEIGSGFASSSMKGSEHNDIFDVDQHGHVGTDTNYAGGTLGGISNGSPIFFRVAFKPTSSIQRPMSTVNRKKEKTMLQMPSNARHDLCVAIRAVPVVEAMAALVFADALLMNRSAKLSSI